MKELLWNGNEFVFSDKPGNGVMGIPNDQPDSFAQEVARRYNTQPELLETLDIAYKELLHGIGHDGIGYWANRMEKEVLPQIHAVIAKATASESGAA